MKRERDYDKLLESAVNSISVALAAKRRGAWKPTDTTKALLHFVGQLLLDEDAGEESVGDTLVRQAEDFLIDQGGDGRG
jgi:hypothetical protein